MKQGPVRKAVFPVGGYGTGILPATKAMPKELLAVVDKPLIHYAVEEALRAGMRQMIFVTHRNKRAIEDHFDKAYELESALVMQNRYELLAELRQLFPRDVTYLFVRQAEPFGLGHALTCARVLLGDEPFLVIVPDELVDAPIPAAVQVLDTFRRWGQLAIATLPPGEGAPVHASVDSVRMAPRVARVTRIYGPSEAGAGTAPMAGRFVLTAPVFDYLATTPPRDSGEIELADALAAHARNASHRGARARRRALRLRLAPRLPRGDPPFRPAPPGRGPAVRHDRAVRRRDTRRDDAGAARADRAARRGKRLTRPGRRR